MQKIKLDNVTFELWYDDDSNYFYDDLWQDVSFISNHNNYDSKGELSHLNLLNIIDGDRLDGYEYIPVNAYIHSGIALSLNKFDCPWDSGMFGYLVFKKGEFGENNIGLQGFLNCWESLLNGQVYGFTIYSHCNHCGQDDEILDSCGGFYGYSNMKDMLTDMLDHVNTDLNDNEKNNIIKGTL